MKEEKFPNSRKPSHRRVCGSFGISEGNITRRKTKQNRKQPQNNMHLTATPRGEAAQRVASATSKRGLNREVQAALLQVRIRPECPEDNLRELT